MTTEPDTSSDHETNLNQNNEDCQIAGSAPNVFESQDIEESQGAEPPGGPPAAEAPPSAEQTDGLPQASVAPSPRSAHKKVTRRGAILRWGCGAAAGLGAATIGYGTLAEPHHPVLETVKIPIKGLPPALAGLKIVQLSDLHVQPGFPATCLTPAIYLAQSVRPDLILITGDYINDDIDDGPRYMQQCAERLAELKAPLGVFASFGNHDFPPPPGDPSPDPWIAAGIRPLLDDVVSLEHAGESLYIIGLRSFVQRPVNPADVLRRAPREALRIVLWHEPDRARECAAAGASLQLSGHTHGGQIVIPYLGPPVLPSGGKLYPSGLYWVEGMPLYVSRGVGLLSPRIRLNCPPEVTLIVLESAA